MAGALRLATRIGRATNFAAPARQFSFHNPSKLSAAHLRRFGERPSDSQRGPR